MREANTGIFAKLIEQARKANRILDESSQKRWIKTNEAEKEWLKNSKIISIRRLTARLSTATIELKGVHYFAAVGFENATKFDTTFTAIELNAGITTALIHELQIPIRSSVAPLRIIDEILPSSDKTPDYAGHEYTQISELFEPISIYQINNDSTISSQEISRLTFYWITANEEYITLPFSEKTKSVFTSIALNGPPTIPFDNLIDASQSANWQYAFLETYRCIERLFSFQKIERLHTELAISVPLYIFAKKIETVIGWRPREDEALETLFLSASTTVTSPFVQLKGQIAGQEETKLHNWFYNLRNSVVHFRPATVRPMLDEHQWDDLFQATLAFVNDTYTRYNNLLTLSEER